MVIAAIILVAGGAGTALAMRSRQSEESVEAPPPRQVTTTIVKLSAISQAIVAQGYVESREVLPVFTQVGGEVVYSRDNLRPGTRVSRGDLLVSIDSSDVRSDVELAETELLRGLAGLLASLDTQDPMAIRPKWAAFHARLIAGTVPELPATESERERLVLSTYGVVESYLALERSGRTLSHHNVVAPFDGVILEGAVPEGVVVTPGQQIVTIIDPVNLEISVSVTQDELAYLQRSAGTEIAIRPTDRSEPTLTGTLDRTGGFTDRKTQTVSLYVRFENREEHLGFLPGTFAEVELAGDPIPAALLVPRGVINEDGTINTLDAGHLTKRSVDIRGYRGDRVIVTGAGLRDGMELVTTTIQIPIEGMRLTTESGVVGN